MTELNDLLKQKWYLLDQPWCHSSQAGTSILAGNEDPHAGTFVADTEMMLTGTDDEHTMEKARVIAQHIVDLHNASLENRAQEQENREKRKTAD